MSLADPRWHNPDVLSCIANLSNDEVFTPPHVAKAMLDEVEKAWSADHEGENIWANPNVKFLDPFTKTGVFLREVTNRLNKGLLQIIPDRQERINHILTQQVFGIGITRLTAMIARRSLYCSKFANGPQSVCTEFENEVGNIWFEPVHHTWQGTEKQGKAKKRTCRYCGAAESEYSRSKDLESHAYAFIHADNIQHGLEQIFGENMHFDVVIGNPPYQLSDGGHGVSAQPIYQHFVEQAIKLDPRYVSMIIPSRWFSGGRGLDDFREQMLNDSQLQSIDDFLNASDLFPGVGLKGGVCYFLWAREAKGDCIVRTHFGSNAVSEMRRPLLETGADVFIRFNEGVSVFKKVNRIESLGEQGFSALVSSLRPFGFRTFFRGREDLLSSNSIKIYQNGGFGFVEREEIGSGRELIDSWKLFVGRAAPGTGNKDTYPHRVISTPFLGKPGEICSETYLCIGSFANEEEATSALSYLKTRFVRFLILLHKASQDTTRKVYTFVPMQTWDRIWTDEMLYEKYGLTDEEIAFIESIVRPMEDDSDE